MDVTVMSGVTDKYCTGSLRDNLNNNCVYVCFFLFYNICSGIRFNNIWANFLQYTMHTITFYVHNDIQWNLS